eukprot:NODE_4842_length_635_cov_255.879310.p2 GENE.NODE_4842_length_635_cov_255.879310~~NODE_4842_length_635_cov_255.879310.p2  ORF type:complete len:102 (+),score=37.88 NODE_4842_length_635_cov_255.879310:3-308(+)
MGWNDEGTVVKVFVCADGEPAAIEAAKDGTGGEVEVLFDAKSVELLIHSPPRCYVLTIKPLEGTILPEECKHRVSAGKRVTLTLKKKTEKPTWTRITKPPK